MLVLPAQSACPRPASRLHRREYRDQAKTMIQTTAEQIRVTHDDGLGELVFAADRAGGPQEIRLAADVLVREVRSYLDDFIEKQAVVDDLKGSRKGGTAVVQAHAFYPFGCKVAFTQTVTCAANRAMFTYDLKWPQQGVVRRQFGLGSLFVPGAWARFWCVPPAQQLAERGETVTCQPIPEQAAAAAPVLLGQWQRPPLALVLERADGLRLEIGTGSDLWRWEFGLGLGPDTGSYQLFAERDGLRFVREPLRCSAEFTPAARKFRFTWYAAWWKPGLVSASAAGDGATLLTFRPDGDLDVPRPPPPAARASKAKTKSRKKPVVPAKLPPPCWALDFATLPVPDTCRRFSSTEKLGSGQRAAEFCWEADAVQKRARRVIRQIAAAAEPGTLVIRGVRPGLCWDASHLGKVNPAGLAHWDINAIFDYSEWVCQQLTGWQVLFEPGADAAFPGAAAGLWPPPSVAGLFQPNGFSTARDPHGEYVPPPAPVATPPAEPTEVEQADAEAVEPAAPTADEA